MKTCPVCLLKLDDAYQYCPEDGSSLRSDSARQPEAFQEKIEAYEVASERVEQRAPLLYCPACAVEYPLTFSRCPVHGVALTKQKISIKRPSNVIAQSTVSSDAKSEAEPSNEAQEPDPSNQLPAFSDEIDMFDDEQHLRSVEECKATSNFESEAEQYEQHARVEDMANSDSETEAALWGDVEAGKDSPQVSTKRSLFVAAIVTTVGLAVFAIMTAYVFYSAAQKPTLSADRIEQKPLTIQVKQEPALDPAIEQSQSDTEESNEDKAEVAGSNDDKRTSHHDSLPASARPNVAAMTKNPAPREATRPVQASLPALSNLPIPHGAAGRVDARLIRIRSMKSPSGYHYDLTFSLRELAGQVTQWETLTISTRSASGASHSQTVPFFHRLGAAGSLTFTVSVDMSGRSEADWIGRVVCTSTGSDNAGRLYRASFGANVAP